MGPKGGSHLQQSIKEPKLTNYVAPEPEGSSLHSQEPTNDHYPEPGDSTPHPLNESP
jgi:hypothetical protein